MADKICANCKHHFIMYGEVAGFPKCNAFKQSTKSNVTGKTSVHYDDCEKHNKNGDCPKFEEKDKSLASRIKDWLIKDWLGIMPD